MLHKFGHKRVTVRGLMGTEAVARDNLKMIRRIIAIESMEASELNEQAIEEKIGHLTIIPWRGEPVEECNRGCWSDFVLTDAMVEILQVGRGAQSVLLRHLGDQSIADQIVMLLGGVGNENAIQPVLNTLSDGDDEVLGDRAKRLNLVGNVALTNLTLRDVVGWGSGCEHTLKTCWLKWWADHKATFKEDAIDFRRVGDYPGFGIYEQFNDASLR